ncbi:hypothetical protein JCM11251_006418 [Rhodosporidiobolus azoricus]
MDGGSFPSSGMDYSTVPPGNFASSSAAEPVLFDPSRHSPRSRAQSIASSVSSVSSAVSSFYEGTPETSAGARSSLDFPPATLQPAYDGEGFRVQIHDMGQWSVSWNELVHLLLRPETTAHLPRDHIISQTADFLASRVQPTAPFHPDSGPARPPTGVSLVDLSFDQLGLQEASHHLASQTGEQEQQPFIYQPSSASAHEPPLDESFYAPIPPPTGRRRAAPQPIHTAATFVTPLQQAFVPPGAAVEDSAITPGLPQYAQLEAGQPGYVLHPITASHLPPLPPPPPSVFAEQASHAAQFSSNDYDVSNVIFKSSQALPTPPPLHEQQQQTLSLRPPSLAATRHLRTSTSPYARRPSHVRQASQASISSTSSSLQDFAGSGTLSSRSSSVDLSPGELNGEDDDYVPSVSISTSSSHTSSSSSAFPGHRKKLIGKRTLRPLNRDVEVYLWSPKKAQLSRILAGVEAEEALRRSTEEDAEVITFGPGSYYKVIEDDLEILPSDGKNRVNSWLRGQTCVDMCSFRFEGKRPSVIRQHVVSCKTRASRMGKSQDPLKRLCQLQLDAQTMEAKLRHVRASSSIDRSAFFPDGRPLPPDPPPSATFHPVEEDAFDRRSVASFESQRSASDAASEEMYWQGHAAEESLYSQGDSPHSAGYGPTIIEPSEDVHYALIASSSASAGFSSSSATSASEDAWLAGYGLSVPTGSCAAASSSSTASSRSPSQRFLQPASDGEKMLVSPVSQSFLTMDE